jgi:hypothetical protein
MNDGFSTYDFGDTGYDSPVDWWYDEYDFNLGAPLGPSSFVSPPISPANLITNGSFELPFSNNWTFTVDASAGSAATLERTTAVAAVGNYSAHIAVTAAPPPQTPSFVQFYQGGISLVKGSNYTLSFWARASSPRNMQVAVLKDGGDYESYGLYLPASLTSSWRQYAYTFAASTTATDGEVDFNFGEQTGDTWIDGVTLELAADSIYRRDYTNGTALLNGTTSQQTISLEPGFQRFSGLQAPLYQYILDDSDASFSSSGAWNVATYNTGAYSGSGSSADLPAEPQNANGPYYHCWEGTCHQLDAPTGTAQWNLSIPADGQYTIQAWLPAAPGATSWTGNAVYEVVSGGNVLATLTLDQTTAAAGDGWHMIATVSLSAAGSPLLRVHNSGSGSLIADAVYVTSAARYNDGSPASEVTLAPMDGILLQRLQPVAAPAPPLLGIVETHSGNFTQGQGSATYTVTVSNQAGAGPSNSAVTVTEIAPSGFVLTSMAGTGWICPIPGNLCTRSDALAGGASYQAITVTVSVVPYASSPQVNQVSVSGGGSATVVAADSTTVNPGSVSCAYALNLGGQAFPVFGGAGSVSVTTASGCLWNVSNSLSWVTITGGASGTGNGTVAYQVATNTGGAQTGSLTIAGLPFTVELASAAVEGLVAAGAMAQIASGGLWNSTITLVNTGTSAAEVVLNFLGDNGSPLQLPLTFPQTPSTGPLLASTLDQVIAPGAQLVMQTAGTASQATVEGWAQLLSNGSVGGCAVFDLTTATGTQEAVVPVETRNPSAFVLPFDYTGGYQTGVALANLTNQAVSIPVVLRSATGASLGTAAAIQLPAYAHASFMLATNYPAVAGQFGAMELDTPTGGQISALGIRAAPDGAITTVPVLAAGAVSDGSMAQVASGGLWNTTITLVNTSTSPAQVSLSFYADNGSALQLPVTLPLSSSPVTQSVSTINQTIGAEAQLVIETAGTASQATSEGWAQLTTTGGNVGGSAVFVDTTAAGVQEAVVPAETRNPIAFVLPFNYTGGYATGVALANLTNQAVNIPVVLRDDTGASLGTAAPISLPPNGHMSFMLASSYPAVGGHYGTLELDTPTGGQISALGIRATPSGAITTVPVLAK